jgi:uncharacterized protein (PEP-CTERM system associated)
MAITVMDTALNKKLLAVTLFAILSANIQAGEFEFKPNLVINETYSDNVNLTFNDKESGLTSQTGMQLSTLYSSKKLELSLSSNSRYVMYSHDHDSDNDFHSLESRFRFKLAPKGLSLTGSATISNQSRNSSRNALADVVSGDTARVETYATGLEYVIDNNDFLLNSTIQYTTNRSEDSIGEREGYTANLITRNSNSARYIFWEATTQFADYQNQGRESKLFSGELKIGFITDYKFTPFLRYYDETNEGDISNNNSSIESDSYGGGIRWMVSPKLLLDISYNTPTGPQLDLDGNQQEDYSAASIRWQPSQRTQLTVDYGKRFYGESYGLDFTHKNKRLTNNISYVEEVQAFTRNNYETVAQGNYWCPPDGDNDNVIDSSTCFINNNGSINFDEYLLVSLNDFVLVEDFSLSLNKQLNWSSVLQLPRTTFSFSLSSLNRENLDTRIEDETQRASFSIKRKVSGKSNIQLNIGYTNENRALEQEDERNDRYRRYSLEYDKSLNSQLSFTLGVSHLNRSSTTQSFNYEEDRIYLNFSKGF